MINIGYFLILNLLSVEFVFRLAVRENEFEEASLSSEAGEEYLSMHAFSNLLGHPKAQPIPLVLVL